MDDVLEAPRTYVCGKGLTLIDEEEFLKRKEAARLAAADTVCGSCENCICTTGSGESLLVGCAETPTEYKQAPDACSKRRLLGTLSETH